MEETDITDECINFLDYALHSKWDRLVISSIIQKKVLPKILEYKDIEKIKKIVSIIFSFEYKEPYRAVSFIDSYYLGMIFEKYFDILYEKVGTILIDIIEDIISRLKPESLLFLNYSFSNKMYPNVDSISYPQTLINCYIWLILKQKKF